MPRRYLRQIPPAWRTVARVFVALGDGHRQRILLLFEPGERLTAGEIAAASTLSRPTVSHHLKVLREAGVLASEKRGREVYFWVDRRRLLAALAAVADYVRGNA
ncbi:MAG: helix-turn-helix domain-containing protein [Burkholderiales bacterium]|nr:helix-turn-helix domain-containing protein [Burkholderiales bacterium]